MSKSQLLRLLGAGLLLGALLPCLEGLAQAPPPPATDPPQIPLCMIGDSITWAEVGDTWRQYLLQHLPSLAFVGTHTGCLGYSHAGEGGNGAGQVLARLPDIPDCPYYHLLIGTNDDGAAQSEADLDRVAAGAADRIVRIVNGLLQKPSVKKVFLASVLPCETDNPFRDQANARANTTLREEFAQVFPAGKVVWVEYERPIRATPNWGPIIRLHPTLEGYQLVAKILADALRQELGLPERPETPKARPGCGVRVVNLWTGGGDGHSAAPIIAGWYTLSCDVRQVAPEGGELALRTENADPKSCFSQSFKVPADAAGKRLTLNFFTGYAGYGYATAVIQGAVRGCTPEKVLLEKRRPSGQASVYGDGSYLDVASPWQPGELVESVGGTG